MVYLPTVLVFASIFSAAYGAPLSKRIAQTIADSTQKWVQACEAAGGADKCSTISVSAFSTLLAAAGPCDQQNSADAMVDLAKQLNNDPDMIKFAQIFTQQPRNTPNSQAVPYCQQAPKNSELNGLFQCQFQGADQTTFVGGIKVGGAGTVPFGLSAPVNPPGACAANPTGPITDGSQLTDITQDPGLANIATLGGSGAGAAANAGSADNSAAIPTVDNTPAPAQTTAPAPQATAAAPPPPSVPASASGDFHLQNGQDAQALNAKFATLTASSSCNDGDQACISGGFAQCVGGKFAVSGCAGGTQCIALPLVNKAGTSLACTTQADALARIQATGAQGGIDGN